MDPKRLNYLTCRLNRFELTSCEKRFIELLKSYHREECELTEEQETILQGLYNEKLSWAKLGLIREKSTERSLAREQLT